MSLWVRKADGQRRSKYTSRKAVFKKYVSETGSCVQKQPGQQLPSRYWFGSNALLLEESFHKNYISIKIGYILRILVVKCLAFFWHKYYVITPYSTDVRHEIVEPATEKVTCYGCFGVLAGKDDTEAVVPDTIRHDVGDETIRKKRFPKS